MLLFIILIPSHISIYKIIAIFKFEFNIYVYLSIYLFNYLLILTSCILFFLCLHFWGWSIFSIYKFHGKYFNSVLFFKKNVSISATHLNYGVTGYIILYNILYFSLSILITDFKSELASFFFLITISLTNKTTYFCIINFCSFPFYRFYFFDHFEHFKHIITLILKFIFLFPVIVCVYICISHL